jgi:FlaA1/EpsC-like NDP-sugar epimerase
MATNIASYGLLYVSLLVEAALVFYLARSSQWKKQGGVAFYLTTLLVAESARTYVLQTYGYASRQYRYVYWSTDFLLVICASILVCLLFRRACSHEKNMWRFVRLLLGFTFVVVLGISGLTFLRNYRNSFPYFQVEFNQNLYFTCLVLNTLLYLLLQQIESTDDQLGLLVCGVGIQFAGPAATFALVHLTTGDGFARSLAHFVIPTCNVGMLLVWAYAIVHVKGKATKVTRREMPVLAEVTADLNV